MESIGYLRRNICGTSLGILHGRGVAIGRVLFEGFHFREQRLVVIATIIDGQ